VQPECELGLAQGGRGTQKAATRAQGVSGQGGGQRLCSCGFGSQTRYENIQEHRCRH
jgi:hypothetical protein